LILSNGRSSPRENGATSIKQTAIVNDKVRIVESPSALVLMGDAPWSRLVSFKRLTAVEAVSILALSCPQLP